MRRQFQWLLALVAGGLWSAGLIVSVSTAQSQAVDRPHPQLVKLDPQAREYTRVLGGPPATVTMRSGYVVLAPGASVGKHGTGGYEEAVVVLEGEGRMVTTQGDTLSLTKWSVAYCPPQTEHDVTNTGSAPLRYVYLVASAGAPK